MLIFSLAIIGDVIAVNQETQGTYTKKIEDGIYKKKAWSDYWTGCTRATISCDSDQYLVGEAKKGSTAEYSNFQCRPEWYEDNLTANDQCTTNSMDDYWINVEKEYSKEDAVKGGSVSKTQCGASGGGGPEAKAGVAILCYEESAFEQSICDERGKTGECISNKTHDLNGEYIDINSIFEMRDSAFFKAQNDRANLNISNSSYLSGVFSGAFDILTPPPSKPVISPGSSFRPEGGNIVIGKEY